MGYISEIPTVKSDAELLRLLLEEYLLVINSAYCQCPMYYELIEEVRERLDQKNNNQTNPLK